MGKMDGDTFEGYVAVWGGLDNRWISGLHKNGEIMVPLLSMPP